MGEDTRVLVSPGRTRRSSSYTEPGASLHSTLHSAHLPAHYRAGLSRGCCHLEDTAALRMIVVWMATVAVVVLVALIVEIVSQEHTVTVGDVVTDHPSCSDIGKEILKLGGNAVDAAVAASLCLAVAVPHRAGLGGGGVMLVHDVRRNHTAVLDFLEVSPASLDIRQYTDNPATARRGPRAVGVPGFLAGLRHAHRKYGSGVVRRECCGWGDLLRSTLDLLRRGFKVAGDWDATKQAALQETRGGSQELRDFLKADGYTRPGTKATDIMEKTMNALFEDPVEQFYTGAIGRKLSADLAGHIDPTDLETYAVEEREVLRRRIGQYTVLSSPAPTAGPELLALLGAVERLKSRGETTYDGPVYLERLAALMEGLHREARLLGDPATDQEHQLETGFISVEERTRALLDRDNIARWESIRQKENQVRGMDAWQAGSHLAVMDDQDLYVSTVLSIGGQFGSRSFSQGFLLNNALASFDLSPLLPQAQGGEKSSANLFSEGRRPLSRMAPVVAVNTAACGLRILMGGALVEVTGQVLAPVLLSSNGDVTRYLNNPKLVMANGTARVEAGLDSAVKNQVDLEALELPVSPVSALEKVLNKATGFTDLRAGQQEDRWATLTPKYVH